MIDQTALCIALRRAGYSQEEIFQLLDGWVWLGDLSGMEVVPTASWDDSGNDYPSKLGVQIAHRCSARCDLPPMDGMVADGSAMLGNLVEFAARARDRHACAPHQPSPEHRERLARWAAAAGPQAARAGTLAPMSNDDVRGILGDTAADQLDVVRALTRSNRPVDGPGCTPLQVSPPIAGRSLEELRADGGDV